MPSNPGFRIRARRTVYPLSRQHFRYALRLSVLCDGNPFRKTQRVAQWVRAVLSKKMSVKDFFKEIAEDLDYWTDMRVLKALIRRHFR